MGRPLTDQRSDEARQWRKLYATKAWRRGRVVFLRQHPLCERCSEQGRVAAASVVNHRVPHKGDEVLFFQWENWQSLCKSCHDGPTQEIEHKGFATDAGLDGWPLDPRHPANRGGGRVKSL